MTERFAICFVCLGNICRSPTAEGVMAREVGRAGLGGRIRVDSAGTAAYHSGELADPRTRRTAKAHGIELTHRARQVEIEDFDAFDLLVAMDQANVENLQAVAPKGSAHKIVLFRGFDASAPDGAEVPDPYYGGERGFDDVFAICERASAGLLEHVQRILLVPRHRGID